MLYSLCIGRLFKHILVNSLSYCAMFVLWSRSLTRRSNFVYNSSLGGPVYWLHPWYAVCQCYDYVLSR